VCPSLLNLLAGSNSLVQVPLSELLLELDADPDEVEELSITAACVQVGEKALSSQQRVACPHTTGCTWALLTCV
jgi:hypothetical protein